MFISITQGAGGPVPTKIGVDGAPFTLGGGIRGSAPKRAMDPNFEIITETYDGSASFTVPIAVAADAQPGAQTLTVSVRFQTCNDQSCLPPKTIKVTAPIEITAGTAATNANTNANASPSATPTPKNANANVNANTNANLKANANANTNATANTEVNSAENTAVAENSNTATNSVSSATVSQSSDPPPSNFNAGGIDANSSLLSFIWTAILAGALSLLTPCVFPMIPITVSYFTNHAEGSRANAVRNALVFALGIIFTFTVLGLFLAVFFGAAGINKFAASPYVNILSADCLSLLR